MAEHNEIIPAIANAMGAVKKIGRDSKNAHDGYDFASIDKFLELVNPICAANGLIVHMVEDGIEDFVRKGKYGDNAWMRVRFIFTMYHVSGQSMPPEPRTVEVLRNGAQAYGSAQSYALKQFLRAKLLIPTGDKDDADHQATDTGLVKNPPLDKGRRFHGEPPHHRPVHDLAVEPPHDSETGELLPEGTGGATMQAWVDAVLDELGIVPEFEPNGKRKKLAPADAERFEKAYAARVNAKIKGYKKLNWLNLFLSVHEPVIAKMRPDIQGDVHATAAQQRAQINGEKFDPADFAPAGMYSDGPGPEDYLRG